MKRLIIVFILLSLFVANGHCYRGSIGDMRKYVYDTDKDEIVDNSELLGGLPNSSFLRSDQPDTGTDITFSTLTILKAISLPAQSLQGADIMSNEITDTQLAYNTGQHLTIISDVTHKNIASTYGLNTGTFTTTGISIFGDDCTFDGVENIFNGDITLENNNISNPGNIAWDPEGTTKMGWTDSDADANYLYLILGGDAEEEGQPFSRNFIVNEDDSIDWGHPITKDPMVFIQSSNSDDVKEYIVMWSSSANQGRAYIASGKEMYLQPKTSVTVLGNVVATNMYVDTVIAGVVDAYEGKFSTITPKSSLNIAGEVVIYTPNANVLRLGNGSATDYYIYFDAGPYPGSILWEADWPPDGRFVMSCGLAINDICSSFIKATTVQARDSAGLKLYDDGGNGIFVQDGGQVGIGTTDLGIYQFRVANGMMASHKHFHIFGNGTDSQHLKFYTADGTGSGQWASINTMGNDAGTNYMRFQNGGGKFYFDGKLGIGTTSPEDKLDIEYEAGVNIQSFRGTTDTDITGWILYNADGEACYVYPNASQDGIIVSDTKP